MNGNEVVDAALEFPIAPSFSRVGYSARRRSERWGPAVDGRLDGRTVLITGGTSGLGRALALELVGAGASVIVSGRGRERTDRVATEIGAESIVADMADLDAVAAAVDELGRRFPGLDTIVHNAGALSAERQVGPSGIEVTIAAQVVGPFLMTTRLLERLGANGGGMVLTVSSGGMYTAPLEVEGIELDPDDYQGSRQYALAKRAQVTLNELWAARGAEADVVFHAMHPGWVDTPGVAESLPGFRRVMGPLLRSPSQGVDTMAWLVAGGGADAGSGRFWHDRRVRPIHRLARTRRSDTPARRRHLWEWCTDVTR